MGPNEITINTLNDYDYYSLTLCNSVYAGAAKSHKSDYYNNYVWKITLNYI